MTERSYWLDLFSGVTWKEFLEAGGAVSGFSTTRRNRVRKIAPGDYLVCYLTGLSRFIGVLEVLGKPFTESSPIWKQATFPERLPVKVVHALDFETAVPISTILGKFSWYDKIASPIAWTGHFRGSPARMADSDGAMVVETISEAAANPVKRSYDKAKLRGRRATGTSAALGPVIVPETVAEPESAPVDQPKDHVEIQHLLLKLGGDLGMDVWVAKNDRSREYKGKKLGELPNMRSQLPLKFDPVTNKTIELIDVLWLKSNAIVAAFEVESTTSIYSGLLRMGDLIALQPNLNIPLYIVAPDDRRDKVIQEINRPTFRRLSPAMSEVTRYIPFDALRKRVEDAGPLISFLKPEFINDIAEEVEVEEDE